MLCIPKTRSYVKVFIAISTYNTAIATCYNGGGKTVEKIEIKNIKHTTAGVR
jgi:hypothetical protein